MQYSKEKKAEKDLRKNKTLVNQIEFKKSKANFKRILAIAKENYWTKYCSGLKSKANIKQVWEIINKIKGKTTKSTFFFKDINNEIIDDKNLSNIFADKFISLSSNKNFSAEITKSRTETINEFLISYGNKTFQDCVVVDSKLINESYKMIELSTILKNVNLNSSPGCD